MRITEVSVTVSKTVQVVQFEPVTVSCTVKAEVEEGDSIIETRAQAHKAASNGVSKYLEIEVEKYRSKTKKG